MSYYKVKNIKIDKKNNTISAILGDSSLRDYDGNLIYEKCENMYSEYNTINDKIACLYYDIICGYIHASGKYSGLVCSFDYFGDFCNDFKEVMYKENRKDDELYGVYLKYQDEFKRYTTKNCILKVKGAREYLKRITKTHYFTTIDKEKAKKFNDLQVKINEWYIENFDIEYI